MIFLFDFTLFVIDIHQIMLISLFPTPFTFMGLADSYYGMILDCNLPNSCFRSGNSLGRVSMIDGCLSHMINDQVRHFDLSIEKILPCPERCLIRGPEVLGSWGSLSLNSIFTLHRHSTPVFPSSIFTL